MAFIMIKIIDVIALKFTFQAHHFEDGNLHLWKERAQMWDFFLDAQIQIIQIHFVVRSTHCEFHMISLQSLNKIR